MAEHRRHRSRAVRIIARITVFLLLGTLVNAAVAASLWFWGSRPTDGIDARGVIISNWKFRQSSERDVDEWQRWATGHWPAAPDETGHQSTAGMRFRIMVRVLNGYDPSELRSDQWAERAQERRLFSIDVVECGWPLATAAIAQATEWSGFPPISSVRRDGVVFGRLVMPSRPVVPGFALNTMLYAAILWMVVIAPFAIRRRVRIRRGLCPACAYPAGVSPVCTECGRSLPTSAVRER